MGRNDNYQKFYLIDFSLFSVSFFDFMHKNQAMLVKEHTRMQDENYFTYIEHLS